MYNDNYNYNNNYNINYNNSYNNSYRNNQYINYNRKVNLKKIILISLIIVFIVILITSFVILKNLTKEYTMTFNLNGSNSISKNEIKCKSNIRGKCIITLPEAKRDGGEVLGYALDANSKEAKYKALQKVEMTSDMTLYVISKKINILTIDKSNIDEVETDDISCILYNTETSCEVTVPMFNKLGYKIDGYTKDKDNKNDIIAFNSKLNIDNNTTLYPLYDEYPNYTELGKTHFNIERSVYIYNSYLDIGAGCSSSIANKLVEDLRKLYEKYPFYAYYSKLSILGSREYDNFTRVANIGASSGFTDELAYDNPTVLIKCTNDRLPFIVAIHELTHAMDVRYKVISGHYLNQEQELIDLRNKYKNTLNRPLRDYAYSDVGNSSVPEFLAELITFYYFNVVDTSYNITDRDYRRGNFPDDMKKMAEKYLCIGKNNYNKSKCS